MPMTKAREDSDPTRSEVEELLDRRATIEDWLTRLEDQRGKVSERIIERVREDYQNRLREALDALGAHRRAIQEQVDRAREALALAEARRAEAAEELEEAQLRTLIGEIDETSWAEQEPRLTTAVSETAEAAANARDEAERLSALLDQLDERERTPAPNDEPAVTPGRLDALIEDPDPDATIVEGFDAIGIATVVELPANDADDEDSFLSEIDLALGTTNDEDRPVNGELDTAPKPGVKCGECGYTNDINAWFCGVCGADVG
jgi:hypothetical protein